MLRPITEPSTILRAANRVVVPWGLPKLGALTSRLKKTKCDFHPIDLEANPCEFFFDIIV